MSVRTLAELFLKVAARDQPDCLLHKVDGAFRPISAADLARDVRRLAGALQAMGVRAGDRVALMADNGPHWPIVDFATLASGAVLVPIYPTLTPEQAAYIADDCGARVLLVQDAERLLGLLAERERLRQVERFVLIGDAGGIEPEVPTLDNLVAETAELDRETFEARARAIEPDDLATFIYTSGTTGRPKGVVLTHGNIASNVVASLEVLGFKGHFTALSFLPLSHSFERTVAYCYFLSGTTIAYAESVRTVPDDLRAVEPHVFVSVPRIYEKILASVRDRVGAAGTVQRALFRWAEAQARRGLESRLAGKRPGVRLRVADALVFRKIRAVLGSRFTFAVSGGAPLAPDVAAFFWGAGVRIFEGYGLSETSPVLCVNRPDSVRLGTVGPPIPGVEIRIAEDGEILARGPNIMQGYFNLPEATSEVLDADGWFSTGDIGSIDDAGHLRITDRKKELIVNAYGKNIAPAPIENALKASPMIEHAVVLGDRRKFLTALLAPDLRAVARRLDVGAEELSEAGELAAQERIRTLFDAEVEAVNETLSRYQRIRAWRLLEQPLSVESGELTPTQKVKRRVIRDRYADLIDRMYAGREA